MGAHLKEETELSIEDWRTSCQRLRAFPYKSFIIVHQFGGTLQHFINSGTNLPQLEVQKVTCQLCQSLRGRQKPFLFPF